MDTMVFSEFAEINPQTRLAKGQEYPFVAMEIVEPHRRYVIPKKIKIFSSGGTKFLSGDTLFARITPCLENGKIAQFIAPGNTAGFGSTEFFVFRNRQNISDPSYIYYLAKSDIIRKPAEKSMSGASGRQRVDVKSIQTLRIPAPPLPVQRKIASILSAYDDLIENNLRRIKILEEMAKTIYEEWFVKFRFPGHKKVKMVESELGPIPEGWEVKPLESLISEHIGGGWGKENPDGAYTETAFVVRGTDIPGARCCNISNVPYRYHILSNLRPRQLMAGDIIFEVSGGSKGQPLGRTLYISSELLSAFGGERVICASFCKRIRPDARLYSSEILYLSFLEAYDSGEIEQFQVQSTGISNFKWTEYIQQTYRRIPPVALQARFGELANPLFSQIATLGLKNRDLRHTRDLLLPKLISGEINVKNLDIQTGDFNEPDIQHLLQ